MSRTNHYRLCGCREGEPICYIHNVYGFDPGYKPVREILGRRNWRRKTRFPKYSVKSFHEGPPRWWWQEKHSTARAIYRTLMRGAEDPVLPREQDLIDLWGWY